jgi:SAM-dependent methyltransferase
MSTPTASASSTSGPTTLATDSESWWDGERLDVLDEVMSPLLGGGPYLDVGCGRGAVADRLAGRGALVVACDAHLYDEWQRGPGRPVYVVASSDALPFRDGAFTMASACDVIEHLPDERPTLEEMRRVARPGSHLVITVPAFPQLWSDHDVAVGHFRRYQRNDLGTLLSGSGIQVDRLTYFFSWLAGPALLLRRRRREVGDQGGNRTVAGVARRLSRLERGVLRRFDLPVGTSLLALGRRR